MLSFTCINSQTHYIRAHDKNSIIRSPGCTCYYCKIAYDLIPFSFMFHVWKNWARKQKIDFYRNKNNVYFLENKEGFLVLMFILLRQYSSIDVNFQFENIFVNFKLSFMLCIHYIQYKVSYTQKLLKMLKVVANI